MSVREVRLFVGNLSFNTSQDELIEHVHELCSDVQVVQCEVIMDRATNRSKGFGFVNIAPTSDNQLWGDEHVQGVCDALNGVKLDGRSLTVNIAKPKPVYERSAGGAREYGRQERNDRGKSERGMRNTAGGRYRD